MTTQIPTEPLTWKEQVLLEDLVLDLQKRTQQYIGRNYDSAGIKDRILDTVKGLAPEHSGYDMEIEVTPVSLYQFVVTVSYSTLRM